MNFEEAGWRELTANEFKEMYGYWSKHPYHDVGDWQYEIANGDTRQSYWEWVQSRMDEAEEDES